MDHWRVEGYNYTMDLVGLIDLLLGIRNSKPEKERDTAIFGERGISEIRFLIGAVCVSGGPRKE